MNIHTPERGFKDDGWREEWHEYVLRRMASRDAVQNMTHPRIYGPFIQRVITDPESKRQRKRVGRLIRAGYFIQPYRGTPKGMRVNRIVETVK